MPELDWDEADFLECLEVIPVVDDYDVRHSYEVIKNGLVLALTVKQLESFVRIALRQQETKEPMIEFTLFVRGGVRYINDKRGRYLEFRDSVIVPDRFSYPVLGVFDKTKFPHDTTIQLQVNPEIHIRLLQDWSSSFLG